MVWMSTGRHAAVIVTVLGGGAWWGSLLVRDLLTMWAWHWPFSKPIFTWFDALNKRFGLLEKAGLFVIVTLGMRFLAHIS
ncbi:hypothetical protein BGV69_24675 [Burkholderia ubonensis]|nr:hypothetical protein BGV69_24675 [Burkholderia ubonensis]